MLLVGGVGLFVGLAASVLGVLLAIGFIQPTFCQTGSDSALCANLQTISYQSVLLVVSALAVPLFVRFDVFRPLPLIAFAVVAMWNYPLLMQTFAYGWEFYIGSALLGVAMYILLFWVLRIRNFYSSLIGVLAVTALVAWLMIA